MGFASGFGDAFSKSYGQASNQRASRLEQEKAIAARKEESEYEWKMKGLLEKKESREKLETKDREAKATAKSISEMTGAPLSEVYSRLKGGSDASIVKDWAEKGDWSGVKYNGGNIDLSSVPNPANIDDEAQSLGVAASESPVSATSGVAASVAAGEVPNPVSEDPTPASEGSNYATTSPYKLKPTPVDVDKQVQQWQLIYTQAEANGDEVKMAEAQSRLEAFGRSKDMIDPPTKETGSTKADLIRAVGAAPIGSAERVQAQADLDSYTQTEASQGILSKGEQLGTVLLPSGERVVTSLTPVNTESGVGFVPRGSKDVAEGASAMSEDEKTAYTEFQKVGTKPEVLKQTDKVVGLTSMLRSSARLQKIVEKDEGVLPSVTGSAVDFLDATRKEFQAATNLFGVELKKNGAGATEASSMDALQKKVNSIDVSAITDRAELRDLFNAEMNLLVYRAGDALGQTGQAFSGKDFNLIAGSLRGSTSGPAFKENLNGYMNRQLKSVEDSGVALSDVNSAAKNYKDVYGYLPIKAMPSPSDFIASRIGEGEDIDGELQAGYIAARQTKAFNGITDRGDAPTPNVPTEQQSTPNVNYRLPTQEEYDASASLQKLGPYGSFQFDPAVGKIKRLK